nr:unnamed protein product [Callosobruchus analis]
MATGSKPVVVETIPKRSVSFYESYREQVCLWDVKSKDYSNKQKRNASYEMLLQKLKEINPQATIEILKKKINNMRTAFRRELKKVQSSKGTGQRGDTYQPTLWYFDLLLFTTQAETGRKGISTDEMEESLEHETVDTFDDCETQAEAPLTPFSSASDIDEQVNSNGNDITDTPQICSNTVTPQTSRPSSRNFYPQKIVNKRKRINAIEQKREELVHLAHTALSSNDANPDPEDEYLIAGKRIGYQLKAIEGQQKIIAEKLISDVIFYANMGKLTEHCSINVPSSSSTTHVSCPTNQKPHDSVQNSGFQSIEIGDGTYTTLTSQPSQVLNRESNSHMTKKGLPKQEVGTSDHIKGRPACISLQPRQKMRTSCTKGHCEVNLFCLRVFKDGLAE